MTQHKQMDPIVELKEIWQFLRHHRWPVLFGGVMLSTIFTVGVMLFVPTFYTASITVQVDPQKIPSMPEIVTMDELRFDTLAQQTLSTTRLEKVVDDLQLCAVPLRCRSKQAFIDSMRGNISIRAKSGGKGNLGTFVLSYKGTNAKEAAQIVSHLANGFMQWDLAVREHQASRVKEFLSAEQQQAKQALDERETKFLQFKTEHMRELPKQAAGSAELSSRLQANSAALERLEQEKAALAQGQDSPLAEAASSARDRGSDRARLEAEQRKLEALLLSLRARYSDEYPDVEQTNTRLSAIREQLTHKPTAPDVASPGASSSSRMTSLSREIARLQAERSRLVAKSSTQQGNEDSPLLQAQLADLARDYQDAKSRYMALVDKNAWAVTAAELEHKQEAGRFSILDPAIVPEKPMKSRRVLMIAFLILLSFVLSAARAILFERIVKATIGTESGLQEMLSGSVPILGCIPEIATPDSVRRKRQSGVIAVAGSLACCAIAAVFLRKLPPFTLAATGPALCCLTTVVFLQGHSRKPAAR